MRIVAFEIEDREQTSFAPLEHLHDIAFEGGTLISDSADAEVVSVFIYSDLERQALDRMNKTGMATLTMNPALDTSSEVSQLVPDKKLRCEAPRFEADGGGVNVARVISRLGGQVMAVLIYYCSAKPGVSDISVTAMAWLDNRCICSSMQL